MQTTGGTAPLNFQWTNSSSSTSSASYEVFCTEIRAVTATVVSNDGQTVSRTRTLVAPNCNGTSPLEPTIPGNGSKPGFSQDTENDG
jgi:hypothetical protein